MKEEKSCYQCEHWIKMGHYFGCEYSLVPMGRQDLYKVAENCELYNNRDNPKK